VGQTQTSMPNHFSRSARAVASTWKASYNKVTFHVKNFVRETALGLKLLREFQLSHIYDPKKT